MMVQTKADDISEAEHSKMVWSPVVGVSMTGFVHGGSFLQEQCHTWKCIHALSIGKQLVVIDLLGHQRDWDWWRWCHCWCHWRSAISMMLSRAPDIFPWPRSLHISLLALALQKPEVWRLEGHGFSLLSRKLRVFYGKSENHHVEHVG